MAKLTHTVSGNNVTSFRSADIANIESLKCYFLPVQEGSGNPSPENVRPISGWNGIQIQYINKNFIKKYYTTSTEKKGLTIIPTEKGIHISGTAIDRTACMLSDTNHIPFKTNDKVTFSLYLNGDISQCENPYVGYYKKVAVYGNATGSLRTDNNYTFTWTVPSAYGDTDESYIDSYIYIPQGVTVDFEIGLQAELASTLSEFEPHKESIIPITFPHTGKNKVDIGTVTFTAYKQYTFEQELPPGTYTFSATITTNDTDDTTNVISVAIRNYGTTYLTLGRGTRKSQTFIAKDSIYSIYIFAANTYQTSIGDTATYTDVQLELGDTVTIYEPYNNTNTAYGGYIDIVTGEVWRTIKYYTFNGEERITDYSSGITGGKRLVSTVFDDCQSDVKYMYCDKAVVETSVQYQISHLGIRIGGGQGRFYFFVPDSMFDGEVTIDKFKQWLSENSLTATALLITPELIGKLTPMELKTFLSYNNIWSNTNDITEVTYEIIDHLTVKRANIPRLKTKVIWNSLAYPQIKSGQVVNSSGNGTFHITCTMTKADYYTLTESDHYMTIIEGHKYYIHGCPVTDGSIWLLTTCGNNGNQNDKGYGTIATFPKSSNTIRIQIRLEPGTYDFYITPVIVDLTQMFGAGNEPTLIEFEQLCKMNGVNINEAQPFDLGTEKIWYINNYEITKYKTVEWNQLDPMLNSSNWEVYNSSYASVSFDNGVATRTVLQDVSASYTAAIRTKFVVNTDTAHKYYIKQELYSSVAKTYVLTLGANWCRQVAVPAEEWTVCEVIGNPISSEKIYAIYDGNNGNLSLAGYTCKLRNPLVIDLTQMFGAGNEPTLQEFRALCTANGVNLDSALPRDTGTKQLWII